MVDLKSSAVHRSLVVLENLAPAAAHGFAGGVGGFAVTQTLEVAVFELHTRFAGIEGYEFHLDRGEQIGVGVPVGGKPPREDEAIRRIPCKHMAPRALLAVFMQSVPAPTDGGLN